MLQVRTFRHLLVEAAARFGDQQFLIDDHALGAVSYADLLRFASGLEAQFNECGIPIGAPVATLFHNCGIAALLFLATLASRRVLVPLNPLSTKYELDYVLDRARCVAVIADPAHAKCNDFGDRRTISVPDHRDYFATRCATPARMTVDLDDPEATDTFVGEVVFTSGSTGRPKGVVLSERSLLADALALGVAYDLRSTDRFLTVCPLFHNSGQVFTATATAIYLSDGTTGGSTSITVTTGALASSAIGFSGTPVDISGDDLTTATNAQAALNDINTAIANVAADRGALGAEINRLQSASTVITTQVQNLTNAEDGIRAADIPTAVSNMSRLTILEQTGMSALQQSNQLQGAVLKLLQ